MVRWTDFRLLPTISFMRRTGFALLLLALGLAFVSTARAAQDDSGQDESDSVPAEDDSGQDESDSVPAEDGSPEHSAEEASSQGAAGVEKTQPLANRVLGLPPVDALGRPFPDPVLLRMARGWTVGGAILTVAGASMILTGMTIGSAAARGQIVVSPPALYSLLGLMGAGSSMVFVGLPLLSSGRFTTGQLRRTIKGVAKVPRTVANERGYWLAHRRGMYGQAIVIGGGASVLVGVLGVVAAALSANSEFYNPRIWVIPVTSFASGGAMIAFGLFLENSARERMKRIQDAVDPFRQEGSKTSRAPAPGPGRGALALLPLPTVSAVADGRGGVAPRASLNWMLAF